MCSHTGSSPVLTTEGANPETWKDKVGDSWKDNNTVRWRIGDVTDHKGDSRFDSCPDYTLKH